MTGDEFSGVDIDLLADYMGGALDGTPDESVVAALVADDPAWRDAYATLSGGMTAMSAELRQLGAGAEPMPVDVVTRLEGALAELPPLTGATGTGAGSAIGVTTAAGRLHAVPAEGGTGGHRGRGTAAGRRRALRTWAAPVAVAAGALVFAGIGLGELLSGGGGARDQATSTADKAGPMSAPEAGAPAAAFAVTTSGVDYGRETLALTPHSEFRSDSAREPAAGRPSLETEGADPDPPLQRLSIRAALLACLDAIAVDHAAGAITTESVDFARFEGDPALVVRFTANDGSWVWASGPDCGAPGAGADTRHLVRVG